MTSTQIMEQKLRDAGMRPTRQRMSLGNLLFGSGDRHITAEQLHVETVQAGIAVSLATIYNTLNQFTEAGLLREVAVEGHKSYFDTNTSNHCHYYLEDEGRLIDIDDDQLTVDGLPKPPEGMRIGRIDIIVRLEKDTA
ncbi:MAG: iron response transcriptional regulator IrrA [Pseudomonadota bacterium]